MYDINKERTSAAYAAANKKLTGRIRALFPTFWHQLDSTWIVKTDADEVQIRDDLMRLLDYDDELLVVRSSGDAAWVGFSAGGSDWLYKHI